MPAYFPLFMNIEQKKFQVFGAGQVAARRVSALIRYGADVTVTAPHVRAEIRQLQAAWPGRLKIRQRCYQPGEIQADAADYVLAATSDPKVNTAVFRECRGKGIPVNDAGSRRQCDFYFPALIEQDNLVVGVVSTDGSHGKTARVSRALRECLE